MTLAEVDRDIVERRQDGVNGRLETQAKESQHAFTPYLLSFQAVGHGVETVEEDHRSASPRQSLGTGDARHPRAHHAHINPLLCHKQACPFLYLGNNEKRASAPYARFQV